MTQCSIELDVHRSLTAANIVKINSQDCAVSAVPDHGCPKPESLP
jgi:hypothetical protein